MSSRLDKALAEAGLVDSRQRAQALVMAGSVRVNGETERRPDRLVRADDRLELDAGEGWASRGALKLLPVLDGFGVEVEGRVCADIGASTGGFTDVLLRRGASRVFAVDVGRGLIEWRLRQDPRVTLLERTNARSLESFPEPVSLVVIDVSFIGLEKVLPAILRAAPRAEVLALFKPQFQVGREEVGKGGIVRDRDAVTAARTRFEDWCRGNGYAVAGHALAGVTGADGNQEHFYRLEPEAA
ncbi:MAG TPA: TlyA family RNA methyltransferase [Candidatus Dormibacteraeota bacterium]|nr:TlyA family RNA methyltransferase [Candidatus Dormibacteraeota bacterium]